MSTGGIPNVSTIFRDLSHLSGTVNPHNNPNNYSLESRPYKSYNQSSAQEMYSYKQKRHNELMNKLQNSYEENRNLLKAGGENLHQKMMETHFHSRVPAPTSSANWGEPNFNPGGTSRGGFVMPKIKYRHIQDQKKNSSFSKGPEQKQSGPQQQLQKQFYEDSPSAFKNSKNILQAYKTEGFSQTKQNNPQLQEFQDDAQSQASHRSTRTNNNAGYEDKLESYYNLCRKNLVRKEPSAFGKQQSKNREDKFLRAGGTKNKAMRLDQAMKILSFD